MEKKLYRSHTSRMVAGVCGGIGEYLGIDPTLVRVIWAVLSLCSGIGLAAYVVCVLVIPDGPEFG